MGVGMKIGLQGHDPQHKIGVMTAGWINGPDGRDLCVRGILYARDFPQEIARIQALSREHRLGMSFELAQAEIEDPKAIIWRIRSCVFTGAAILERSHAAYYNTALAAEGGETGGEMDITSALGMTSAVLVPTVLVSADLTSGMAGTGVTFNLAANATDLATIQANMDSFMQTMQRMGGQLESYQACMAAMDRCVGMRAEMDGLVEALEHLVKMHNALHQMGGEAAAVAADAGTTTSTTAAEGAEMDAETKAILAQMAATQVNIAAAVKLLTDGQQRIEGLITDHQQGDVQGLLTDGHGRLNATNGLPRRRSLQAQGDYERCIQKYGLEKDKTYNEREVDALLKNAGITEIDKRLAVKLEMQAAGIL